MNTTELQFKKTALNAVLRSAKKDRPEWKPDK